MTLTTTFVVQTFYLLQFISALPVHWRRSLQSKPCIFPSIHLIGYRRERNTHVIPSVMQVRAHSLTAVSAGHRCPATKRQKTDIKSLRGSLKYVCVCEEIQCGPGSLSKDKYFSLTVPQSDKKNSHWLKIDWKGSREKKESGSKWRGKIGIWQWPSIINPQIHKECCTVNSSTGRIQQSPT